MGIIRIHKLQFENFKSYAGKKEIGPFHHLYTSIVGPNGSGKSNVIDGLLFVFGYKATKLRLKKATELIHNSDLFPNCQHTSVTVVIHEVDPSTQAFLKEYAICRNVHVSGRGSYSINGTSCEFSAISALLSSYGVDLSHNRFLILQGEVETIALMKPKAEDASESGLLEYIEDIVGTSQYRDGIKVAEDNFDQLSESCMGATAQYNIVEKERAGLLKARDEVLAVGRRELTFFTSKADALRARSLLHVRMARKTAAKQAETEELLASESKANESIVASLTALNQAIAESEREEAALDEQRQSIKTQRDAAKSEAAKRTKQIKLANSALKKTTDNFAAVEKKLFELQGDEKRFEKMYDAAADKISKLEKETEKKAKAVEKMEGGLSDTLGPLRLELEEAKSRLGPRTEKMLALKGSIDHAAAKRGMLQQRLTEASGNSDSTELKLEMELQANEVAELKAVVEAAQSAIASLSAELDAFDQRKYNPSRSEADTISRELQSARGKLYELQNSMTQHTQRSTLDNFFCSAELPGYHGRLGDLGGIDGSYDVAVSTACGALHNYVVEDYPAAESAVKLLQEHKKGRASFIVLTAQERLRAQMGKFTESVESGKFSFPQGVVRLFDLIQRESQYDCVFYHALRDTLVAPDIHVATEVAFGKYSGGQRFRVVTLCGRLVESSGVYSGGGQPCRGAMSAKVASAVSKKDITAATAEVQKLEKSCAKLKEKLQALSETRAELEETLREQNEELNASMTKYSIAKKKLQSKSDVFATTEKQAKSRAAARGAEIARLSDEIACLDKEVSTKSTDYEALVEDNDDEKEVHRLEKAIEQAGGTQLAALRVSYKDVAAQLAKQKSCLEAAEVDLESTRVAIARIKESDLPARQKAIDAATKNSEELKADKRKSADGEYDQKLNVIEAACEDLHEKVAQLEQQLEAVQAGVLDWKAKEQALKREIKTHADDYTGKIKRINQLHSEICDISKDARELLSLFGLSIAPESFQRFVSRNDSSETGDVGEQIDLDEFNEEYIVQFDLATDLDLIMGELNRNVDSTADNSDLVASADSGATGRLSCRIFDTDHISFPKLQAMPSDEMKDLVRKLDKLAGRLDNEVANSSVDTKVIREYRDKSKAAAEKLKIMTSLQTETELARTSLETLLTKRQREFVEGMSLINLRLKHIYRMLTFGGDAELELVDSLDPFAEGLVFSVRPPRKSWKNIQHLSGGEKTLSSLALVFALHHYKPSPLYVMDEIDAALDFRNVSVVANYICSSAVVSQFLIISLRSQMFELAPRQVGIYKVDNVSHNVIIDPSSFEAMLKQNGLCVNATPAKSAALGVRSPNAQVSTGRAAECKSVRESLGPIDFFCGDDAFDDFEQENISNRVSLGRGGRLSLSHTAGSLADKASACRRKSGNMSLDLLIHAGGSDLGGVIDNLVPSGIQDCIQDSIDADTFMSPVVKKMVVESATQAQEAGNAAFMSPLVRQTQNNEMLIDEKDGMSSSDDELQPSSAFNSRKSLGRRTSGRPSLSAARASSSASPTAVVSPELTAKKTRLA